MSLRGFFRTPRHQSFSYKPRFYDERKEELEGRLAEIEKQKGGDIDAMKSRIKTGIRSGHRQDQALRKKLVLKSNMIIFGMILVLIILVLLFLNKYMPMIVESMGGTTG